MVTGYWLGQWDKIYFFVVLFKSTYISVNLNYQQQKKTVYKYNLSRRKKKGRRRQK